jgi:hypothetical protein
MSSLNRPSTNVHIPEQQSAAVRQAASKSASDTTNDLATTPGERKLSAWLDETYSTILQLQNLYTTLLPSLMKHDVEVEAGLRVLYRIGEEMREGLWPFVERYGSNHTQDQHEGQQQQKRYRAHVLCDALFPSPKGEGEGNLSPFEVLQTLQGLQVYLGHLESLFTALMPTAQALWDEGFVEAVGKGQTAVGRMQSWVRQQVKVRGPQTLLVPVKTG